VIIAIVWVQVPSSALNNKTGIKQNVWSLSCCSKPKRALNPWFKVSPPARSARGMRSPGPHSVSAPLRSLQNRRPLDVLQPIFREATVVVEQVPMVPKSPLRSLQNRRPPDVLQPIFRKAMVVVEQTSYID